MSVYLRVLLLLCLYSVDSSAQRPQLRLPFPDGESWMLTRGYNTVTHTYYGVWADDRFALDFAEAGCGSMGKPILAAADGSVEIKSLTDSGGYGKNLLINHGDGYKTRYAHLSEILVIDGTYVRRGDEIGIIGNTGSVSGSACPSLPGMHLHFALYHNGEGIKPEPISGYSNLSPGLYYTSDNTSAHKEGPTFVYRGSAHTCGGPLVGGIGYDWLYACFDVRDEFKVGEKVQALLRIDDVKSDHRFRVRTLKNGLFQWEWTAGWNHVDGQWDYSHFWPTLSNASAGTWRFEFYVDDGGGFKMVDARSFKVTP